MAHIIIIFSNDNCGTTEDINNCGTYSNDTSSVAQGLGRLGCDTESVAQNYNIYNCGTSSVALDGFVLDERASSEVVAHKKLINDIDSATVSEETIVAPLNIPYNVPVYMIPWKPPREIRRKWKPKKLRVVPQSFVPHFRNLKSTPSSPAPFSQSSDDEITM